MNKKRSLMWLAAVLIVLGLASWEAASFMQSGQPSNIPKSQQIDEVWKVIRGFLSLSGDPTTKIFIPGEGWKTFEEVYPTIETSIIGGQLEPGFSAKVKQISAELSINPNHLLAIMYFETAGTFNPAKKNPSSGAVGLIQFLPSTARELGTTTNALAEMSQIQQLEYVQKYFIPYTNRMNNFGDVAMAVIWPKAIGKDDTFVLFRRGETAYQQNPNLDLNNDGNVTRGEYITAVKNTGARVYLAEPVS